ncbi:MAG: ABC transporter ATP-binding protein [Blautia sp.]|nr:ABC transporter ATP-binding protein [Blautia sp.]
MAGIFGKRKALEKEENNSGPGRDGLLYVNKLSVAYADSVVLREVSFSLKEGQWLMIIGPNGAGKSTIVNAVSQGLPYQGEIYCMGRDVKLFRPYELARQIGILAQNHYVSYSFTVREVVRLGRYAYRKGLFQNEEDDGEDRISQALAVTGLQELEKKSVLELSGGELQRVFLAQLFAQDPRILILDEPTNHLDLVYQKQVFSMITKWLSVKGRAVISVVHDLSLARAYGTHALLLKKGQTLAQGSMPDVFTPEALKEAYSLDVYEWMNRMLSQWRENTILGSPPVPEAR